MRKHKSVLRDGACPERATAREGVEWAPSPAWSKLQPPNSMTKAEKKRLAIVLGGIEFLFLENIALKLVLEHRAVPNWEKLVDHLLQDKEMLAGVRLKFRDLHSKIEQSVDPSEALEGFFGDLPSAKKAALKTIFC